MDEVRRGELRNLAENYASSYWRCDDSESEAFDAIVRWVEGQEAIKAEMLSWSRSNRNTVGYQDAYKRAAKYVSARRGRG